MHCRHEMVSLLFTSPSRLRESQVLCHLSLKQWRRRSRRTRRDVPCEQAGNGRADHCKVCPCAEVNVRAGSLTYSNILTRNPGVLASYIDLTSVQTSFHFSRSRHCTSGHASTTKASNERVLPQITYEMNNDDGIGHDFVTSSPALLYMPALLSCFTSASCM